MGRLLDVTNLNVFFNTYAGKVSAVNGISFSISSGEAVGIVGESGSGKSVAMLSIMKLLAENGKAESGGIIFDGLDLKDFFRGADAEYPWKQDRNDIPGSHDLFESAFYHRQSIG